MREKVDLTKSYKENIRKAKEILKEAGCTDVFLFGSLTSGKFGEKSDIDLAVRGCPKGEFFHLLGKLSFELDYPVDLVNLDSEDAFARYLEREGELVPID